MNLDQRREVVYAKASIAKYGLALYVGQTETVKDRLTTIFMRANRAIYGMPLPWDTKNPWICRKIGVKTTRQQILEACLNFTHKMVNKQTPRHLFGHLRIPRHFRPKAKLSIIDPPRTKKCRRSFFYKAIRQFNDLPHALKYTSIKDFKKKISKRTIREVPDD